MKTPVIAQTLISLLASASVSLGACLAQDADSGLRTNAERLNRWIQELGEIGRTNEGGSLRMSFTAADIEARGYVRELMESAGLRVSVDAAGNLLGRKAGSVSGLAPIMIGSHIDSVPHGGRYDGPVGSLAAIELVKSLAQAGRTLRHPLEVVIFSNEENGKTGSKAMAGEVTFEDLSRPVQAGLSVGEGLKLVGGDPTDLASVRRRPGSVSAFLELHIEQGGILEAAELPIGIVQGIVGIKRWRVVFAGFANHAGTTPMPERRDALVAAARFITAVDQIAKTTPGRQVATVGRIEAHPGAANVIPGQVELSLEIRDLDMAKIDTVFATIASEGERIAELSATEFSAEQYYSSKAAPTALEMQAVITEAASKLGLKYQSMPSGAGHDAQSIAQFAPIGMIFIPSKGGISHSPEEYSSPAHIAAGADVMLHAVLALDRR